MTQVLEVQDEFARKREIFALLVAGEGMKVAAAARDPRLSISVSTAYNWMKEESVQKRIREIMALNASKIQALASQHIEKAMNTLVNALDSPAFTPTQVNAAKAILQYAAGSQVQTETGTTIHVEVNTMLDAGAAEAQAKRARKLSDMKREAIDVPFELIE